MRRVPASLLTLARASTFISLVRNQSRGSSEGEPLMQRHLGVAVEEDLLEVVRELQILDGLRLAGERRVPARLADRLALAHEAGDARVVAQEVGVHVHDELVGQRLGALARHLRDRRLGAARAVRAGP